MRNKASWSKLKGKEQEIIKRFQAGESAPSMASEYGVHYNTIVNLLKRLVTGNLRHFQKTFRIDGHWEEIAALYRTGKFSYSELATKFNSSKATIQWCIRHQTTKEERAAITKMTRGGARNWKYRQGKRTTNEGYHQLKVDGKYKGIHRIAAEEVLGRPLNETEIVHHVLGDNQLNEPADLSVISDNRMHSKLHRYIYKRMGELYPQVLIQLNREFLAANGQMPMFMDTIEATKQLELIEG